MKGEEFSKKKRIIPFFLIAFYFALNMSANEKPVIYRVYPEMISGECVLEIIGRGFGKEKGVLFLNNDEIEILSWKDKKIRAFVISAYEFPLLEVETKGGSKVSYRFEDVSEVCSGKNMKVFSLYDLNINYSKKWRKYKHNEKKRTAILVRKNRKAIIFLAIMKKLPSSSTLFDMVNYLK
ncbi:MAG: hypothetical protein D6734_03890, partial [Candidatus Schekmanbacteria bacterium]